MNNLRPFQIALLGFFGFLMLAFLVFIALFRGGPSEKEQLYGDSVVIWGILDQRTFTRVLSDLRIDIPEFGVVTYIEKDPRTLDGDLINAIADGQSPDLVLLPHTALAKHRTKLIPLSFDTISPRTFQDTYLEGASIFMLSDGVYGIPFAVDPLVMYWNRDLFASNNLVFPPATWEETIQSTVPILTKKNSNLELIQSGIAFGEYGNVTHAKDILAMLMMQSGSPMVTEADGAYTVALEQSTVTNISPLQSSLSFYTQFSLPTSIDYSWNRSQQLDKLKFLGGGLALYFGKGSELNELRAQNPNLNFDIAVVPQSQGAPASTRRTYGDFYAFVVPKASANPGGAFAVAQQLSQPDTAAKILSAIGLAPARRDLIALGTLDPYTSVLYTSAVVSRGWLDPSPTQTEIVFKDMIEGITSGRARLSEAAADAVTSIKLLFK